MIPLGDSNHPSKPVDDLNSADVDFHIFPGFARGSKNHPLHSRKLTWIPKMIASFCGALSSPKVQGKDTVRLDLMLVRRWFGKGNSL